MHSNLIRFEVSVCWQFRFFLICVRVHVLCLDTCPTAYLGLFQPGSCAWFSTFLLCDNYSCVLVYVCNMHVRKCFMKVMNITDIRKTMTTSRAVLK